jgi:hypothetical protein
MFNAHPSGLAPTADPASKSTPRHGVSVMAGLLKFFGSVVGIIFLVGLLVVIGLFALIF